MRLLNRAPEVLSDDGAPLETAFAAPAGAPPATDVIDGAGAASGGGGDAWSMAAAAKRSSRYALPAARWAYSSSSELSTTWGGSLRDSARPPLPRGAARGAARSSSPAATAAAPPAPPPCSIN